MAQLVKNPPATREAWVQPLGWEDPLEKGKATTPVFWPGEFHALYSPWGRRESTRRATSLSLSGSIRPAEGEQEKLLGKALSEFKPPSPVGELDP